MQSGSARSGYPKPPITDEQTRQPTIVTQFKYVHEPKNNEAKLRDTLDQGWRKAKARFRDRTGMDLEPQGKEGVLSTMMKMYAEDNRDARKKDELLEVMGKILNGVEFVGGITAQVGGMIFSPAGLCFNAVQILINVPREFKKLADDLHSLFDKVMNFMATFRILQRTDASLGLDEALVSSTNDVLIALVDICALSIEVRKRKFKAVMSNIFLGDTKVADALDNFKNLVDDQAKLTATVTLEAVLQSKDLATDIKRQNERIEHISRETQENVRDLVAYNTDSKNFKATQETILKIEKALGMPRASSMKPLQMLEDCHPHLYEETLSLITKHSEYKEWHQHKQRRKLLYLSGDSSTGKTYLLAALHRAIEEKKKQLKAGEASIYLVYYEFSRADDSRGRSETPFHKALKHMACQLARQSTKYAEALNKEIDSIRNLGDLALEALWKGLKFQNFTVLPNSVLYLFFDGLDQLKGEFKDLDEMLSSTMQAGNNVLGMNEDEKLRFKIIFTGKPNQLESLDTSIKTISVESVNRPLLERFVQLEMKRLHILQDKRSNHVNIKTRQASENLSDQDDKRKTRLVETILSSAKGSFAKAISRLTVVKEGIDEDLDFDELLRRIESDRGSSLADEGGRILDEVCRDISAQHREQLQELIIWASYGWRRPTLPELEAALYLQRLKQSLEPLERKIKTRFKDCLSITADGFVITAMEVEEYYQVQHDSTAQNPSSKIPKATVQVTIEHVDGPIVKRFFAHLNNAWTNENFDIAAHLQESTKIPVERPQISRIDAHFTLINRCLTALNDDTLREKTNALTDYAATCLPEHIYKIYHHGIEKLSSDQRKTLGQGLINFLSDQECIDAVWRISPLNFQTWTVDSYNVREMALVLKNELILKELEPRDRRWAVKHTTQSKSDTIPFLKIPVRVAASHWLEYHKNHVSDALPCFQFLDGYLNLLENGDLRSSTRSRRAAPSNRSRSTSGEVTQPESGRDEENGLVKHYSDPEDTDVGTNKVNQDSKPKKRRDFGLKERIESARDWAIQKLGIKVGQYVYLRIAETFMQAGQSDSAIEYLLKAKDFTNGRHRLPVMRYLARAYAESKQFEQACDMMLPLIDDLRHQHKEQLSDRERQDNLCAALQEAARYHIEQEKLLRAIELMEEALEYRPDDESCRYKLFELLCETEKLDRAQIIFDEWTRLSNGSAECGPAAQFLKALCLDVLPWMKVIYAVLGSPLHDKIVDALVTHHAQRREDESVLCFARGVALAVTKDEEKLEMAAKSWESCVYINLDVRIDDDEPFNRSSLLCSQYHFDVTRRQYLSLYDCSDKQKHDLLSRLQEKINSLLTPRDKLSKIVDTPLGYVVAFSNIVGLREEARAIMKSDMTDALDILTNDDPADDGFGLSMLFRALLCYGDVVGASSIWSFWDRDALAQRRETERKAAASSQINGGGATSSGQAEEDQPKASPAPEDSYFFNCDGCEEYWESIDMKELWICKFCPNCGFCQKCIKDLRAGRLKKLVCSGEHEHTLFLHYDYEEEEVVGSNVKIGWELIESNGGRDRQRKGGRIVTLKQWVDELRKEWDIPVNTSAGRLQK